MFDPKITEGSWRTGDLKHKDRDLHKGPETILLSNRGFNRVLAQMNTHFVYVEDAKAIAAVPELLAVYKAAKKALSNYQIYLEGGSIEGHLTQDGDDLDVALERIKELEKL